MNAQRMTRVMLAGAVALALTALTVLVVALPATAGPEAQDGWTPLPTPTSAFDPRDPIDFVWEIIPPDDSPRTLPDQVVDGVTFTEISVESRFPDGLDFWVKVETDTELERVYLSVLDIVGRTMTRRAFLDEERQAYRTTNITNTLPVWSPFDFAWCVIDTEGTETCTDYHHAEYWDPTQEWYRMENDLVIVYWYGFGDDNPEHIAREFALATEKTHQRRVDLFGRDLSYKTTHVFFPDEQAAGFALNAFDYRFGAFSYAFVDNRYKEIFATCPLYSFGDEPSTVDWLDFHAQALPLGLAYNLAYDILARDSCSTDDLTCANIGYPAWFYGQTSWASSPFWDYDQRLHNLAALEHIPDLISFGWGGGQAAAEGCSLLGYDVGASFINWLVHTYGIETHRQIVDLMTPTEDNPNGMDFYDAIQQATGKPFDDLETEWRAYLELPPLG